MSRRSGKTASALFSWKRLNCTHLQHRRQVGRRASARMASRQRLLGLWVVGPRMAFSTEQQQGRCKLDEWPTTYNSQRASRPVFVRILARWSTQGNRMERSGPKYRVMLGHRSMRRCCAVGCCLVQFILRSSVDSGLHDCTCILLLSPRHSRLPSPRVHTRRSRSLGAWSAFGIWH